MLEDTQEAFEKEDTILARGVFKKDEFLDDINRQSHKVLETHLKDHPEDTAQALWILSTSGSWKGWATSPKISPKRSSSTWKPRC